MLAENFRSARSNRLSSNSFAVFVLFFGVALLEAIRTGNVIEVLVFLGLGLLWACFTYAMVGRRPRGHNPK